MRWLPPKIIWQLGIHVTCILGINSQDVAGICATINHQQPRHTAGQRSPFMRTASYHNASVEDAMEVLKHPYYCMQAV